MTTRENRPSGYHAGGRPGALKSHWLGTNPRLCLAIIAPERMQTQ